MGLVKKLSACNCHKLTQGYAGSAAVKRSWIEKLLLRFVPHFDIIKTIPGPKCGAVQTHATVVYLRRYYLWRSKWIGKNWGDIYLHHILRSDDDPDPHDHPWGFTGLVLKSGYIDESWTWEDPGPIVDLTGQVVDWREGYRHGPFLEKVKPLRIVRRKAEHIHRVVLNDKKPAWTLIFTSGYSRDWNFITRNGPVFWRTYLGIPDNVDVGE